MTPLTNNECKTVASLDERKHRRRLGLFKAEGSKCVLDTLDGFTLRTLYATAQWAESHQRLADRITLVSRQDMGRISSLTTPSDVLAVYEISVRELADDCARTDLVLALDTIQDPGNLGTIIRVADWYGITEIICSRETADCYSPKVIQATMGSISRVAVHYGDLPVMIARLRPDHVYGTFLDGDDIDKAVLSRNGVIVIGNEGNGISPAVESVVTSRLTIPSYPPGRTTGESLNAAVAAAITISKFRSR